MVKKYEELHYLPHWKDFITTDMLMYQSQKVISINKEKICSISYGHKLQQRLLLSHAAITIYGSLCPMLRKIVPLQ